MKRNIFAVIIYPILWWSIFIGMVFLLNLLWPYKLPIFPRYIGLTIILLPFVVPPLVSYVISKSKPMLNIVFGVLLNHLLFAFFILTILFVAGNHIGSATLTVAEYEEYKLKIFRLVGAIIISIPLTAGIGIFSAYAGSSIKRLIAKRRKHN